MKILDLFCGAGGAAMGLHRAFPDAEIIGIDNKSQPHYPFKFIKDNAMVYLDFPNLFSFDFIWASPPCQHYSSMQHIHKNKEKHPDLIEPVRRKLMKWGVPYTIENVIGAPLLNPRMLCGTMFGLPIAKHRIFESNFPLDSLTPPCNHKNLYDCFHGGEMARGEKEKYAKAIGVDWFMTRPEVRQAIPPAYSEWIGNELKKAI